MHGILTQTMSHKKYKMHLLYMAQYILTFLFLLTKAGLTGSPTGEILKWDKKRILLVQLFTWAALDHTIWPGPLFPILLTNICWRAVHYPLFTLSQRIFFSRSNNVYAATFMQFLAIPSLSFSRI